MLEEAWTYLAGIGIQGVIIVASTIWIARYIHSRFKKGYFLRG